MVRHFLSVSILVLLAARSLAAQGTNFRVLAHIDRFSGAVAPTNHYAGICGMVSRVNGREYALVTARAGTIVYDCSNPAAPVERGMIPGPGSGSFPYFTREVQTFGNQVYVSSDHGPIQVIDMNNPDSPVLAATFNPPSHTLAIDQGTGMLWTNGGGNPGSGCTVFNLNLSATAPPTVATYSSAYVHDCLPVRGYNYLAQIFDGTLRILDIRNLPAMPILSTSVTPDAFPHNVGVTDDDRVAVTTDETINPPGALAVYDISNRSAPVLRGRWHSPNNAIAHNVFVRSRVAIFSCYADGVWAIDISNPAAPTPIGQFDTSPLAHADYVGCWGAWPFQPSGVIYLSDMQSGFWIVEPTCGVPRIYGRATAGTGGFAPGIDYTGGYARVGNATFTVTGAKMRGGAAAILALGFGAGSTSVAGIELAVALSRPVFLFTTVAGGTPGQGGAGSTSVTLPLPNDPSLQGAQLNAQWVVVDSGGPQGLAASQGFEVRLCP